MRGQRLAVGLSGAAQGRFVDHIQRSAVAARQIAEHATTHHQPTFRIERGGDGGEVAVGARPIAIHFVGPLIDGHLRCRSGFTGTGHRAIL